MGYANLSGNRLGPYQMIDALGQGGMGVVYRARDTRLDREVALKLMNVQVGRNPTMRQRFEAEARAIARLDHPNIITLHEFDAMGEVLYFVMEFVRGGSLRNYLDRRYQEGNLLQIDDVLLLVQQVASALGFAHNQGIFHRDVKPGNILLKLTSTVSRDRTNFNAVLTDFGLVRMAESAGFNTQVAIGTPYYMAPEQFRVGEVDGRTDLYALGVILFELLTGRLPFQPRDMLEAHDMHINHAPPRPSEIRPGIPPELEAIVLKTLEKNPADRYQNGDELIHAIELAAQHIAAGATLIDSQAEEEERLDNIQTYLRRVRTPFMSGQLDRSPPSHIMQDRVVVSSKHQTDITVPLLKDSMDIGRDPATDIVLEAGEVSRKHATIERQPNGSYTITDNGSTNGTYVDDSLLLGHVSEPWSEKQTVKIGPFQLLLQRAVREAVPDPSRPSLMAAPDSKPYVRAKSHVSQLNITLAADGVTADINFEPSTIAIAPGSQTSIQVIVKTASSTVRHYGLTLEGISEAWYTLPPNAMQLMPGDQPETIIINLHPPRAATSAAGEYPFTLTLRDSVSQNIMGRGQGTLRLGAFHEYETDLHPQLLRGTTKTQFTITNKGNATEVYTIRGRDREAALVFSPAEHSLSVEAGTTGNLSLAVGLRPGYELTEERTFPFEIRVTPRSGNPQVQRGELVAIPIPTTHQESTAQHVSASGSSSSPHKVRTAEHMAVRTMEAIYEPRVLPDHTHPVREFHVWFPDGMSRNMPLHHGMTPHDVIDRAQKEYGLGGDPANYQLRRIDTQTPMDAVHTLGQWQLMPGVELVIDVTPQAKQHGRLWHLGRTLLFALPILPLLSPRSLLATREQGAVNMGMMARVIALAGLVLIVLGVFNPIICIDSETCDSFEHGLFDPELFEESSPTEGVLQFFFNWTGIMLLLYLVPAAIATLRGMRRAVAISTGVIGLTLAAAFVQTLLVINETEYVGNLFSALSPFWVYDTSSSTEVQLSATWLLFGGGLGLVFLALVTNRPVPTVRHIPINRTIIALVSLAGIVLFCLSVLPPIICSDGLECGIAEEASILYEEALEAEAEEAIFANLGPMLVGIIGLVGLLAILFPHPQRTWMVTQMAFGYSLALFIAVYDFVDAFNNEAPDFDYQLEWGWVVFAASIIVLLLANAVARYRQELTWHGN